MHFLGTWRGLSWEEGGPERLEEIISGVCLRGHLPVPLLLGGQGAGVQVEASMW